MIVLIPRPFNFYNKKPLKAFTLVELSIVIVIIGLIIAGVTAGQSLVRQTKYQSIISQVNQFRQAATAFKLQYGQLPGDLANASSFWPGCDVTPTNCDGNNNRLISYSGTSSKNEMFRFWQLLTLSNLLQGSYSGVAGAGASTEVLPGVNSPTSSFTKTAWYIESASWTAGGTLPVGTNLFIVGGAQTNNLPFGTFIPVNDAQGIDAKIDDGKPYTGKVWGAHSAGCTTGTGVNGSYQTNTANTCVLGFALQ